MQIDQKRLQDPRCGECRDKFLTWFDVEKKNYPTRMKFLCYQGRGLETGKQYYSKPQILHAENPRICVRAVAELIRMNSEVGVSLGTGTKALPS